MSDEKAKERMARKRQRDRDAGWSEVLVKIPTSRKSELKEIVSTWSGKSIVDDVFDFYSEDSSEIRGKGTVFYGRCPRDLARTSDLNHTKVRIAGEIYEVKGLEWWAITRPPRAGEMIGLLVDQLEQQSAQMAGDSIPPAASPAPRKPPAHQT